MTERGGEGEGGEGWVERGEGERGEDGISFLVFLFLILSSFLFFSFPSSPF